MSLFILTPGRCPYIKLLASTLMPSVTSAFLFSPPVHISHRERNKWISAFFTEFENAVQGCCPDTFTGRRLSILLECSPISEALYKEETNRCSRGWPLIVAFPLMYFCHSYYIEDPADCQFTKGQIFSVFSLNS